MYRQKTKDSTARSHTLWTQFLHSLLPLPKENQVHELTRPQASGEWALMSLKRGRPALVPTGQCVCP